MSDAPLPLKSIHHVELLVGNAKQAAYFYRRAFGYSQLAYAGPETGVRDQASYVLQQGDIRLVVSTPLSPDDPMTEYLRLHGDGVLDIAFLVDDVDACHAEAVRRGARTAREPYDMSDDSGRPKSAPTAIRCTRSSQRPISRRPIIAGPSCRGTRCAASLHPARDSRGSITSSATSKTAA